MKDGQKQRNMKDRLAIQSRGGDPRSDKQFFLDLEAAILDGFKVARNSRSDDVCSRNMFGTGQVILYKDGKEFLEDSQDAVSAETTEVDKTEEETSKEIVLESLTKKAELLAFAEANSIEVSSDLKMPNAIKAYLKTQI